MKKLEKVLFGSFLLKKAQPYLKNNAFWNQFFKVVGLKEKAK